MKSPKEILDEKQKLDKALQSLAPLEENIYTANTLRAKIDILEWVLSEKM